MSFEQPTANVSSHGLRIYTLGRFAVYRGDVLITEATWKRRKAKHLFKLLLLAPDYMILKDQVFEWLWPNQSPAQAANNLHYTLFILRRILQPNLTKAANSHYISLEGDRLMLNKEAIAWIDAAEFERLIHLGRQRDTLTYYEAARALYQGDFLPEDLYEDWTSEPRERLKITYTDLLQRIGYLYRQRNALNEAISCLLDLLGVDATNEQAYRDLMGLYAQTGQRHQALHLYQQACDVLRDELNAEPTSETKRLYQTILEGNWPPPVQRGRPVATLKATPDFLEAKQQPFVGRERELRRLETALHRLKEGCGVVTLLSGEQGVGKTRLAKEIVWQAQTAGLQVLYGAAHEQEGHLPYGLFIEAIRSALNERLLDVIQEKLGGLFNDLARILPELADIHLPIGSQLEIELSQERQRLFDAVVATFTLLAEETPLVLFLEDLHAASESSLQLLHYLARRISNVPIFILCTIREEAIKRGTPIARFCKEFNSNSTVEKIKLARFDQHETAHLCLELLPDTPPDQQLSQALHNLTEGNPFFILELLLNLKESGKLEDQGDNIPFAFDSHFRVPASVREVIGLRLERLSHQAYRLAGLAAVIGREFSHNLLRATAQCSESALLDLLDELLNAWLIEATDTGYRFHHGLTRQVIYDELTTHRRAWLHHQVAQALEQLNPHQLDEQAAILVYHFERAGQFEIAFRYLVRAGDWAKATYAPREALEHYNRAISLSRQHHQLMSTDAMIDLLNRRAQTHLALSDFEAAISDFERLLNLNLEIGDLAKEGEALYQLGIAHYWAHRLAKAATYLDRAVHLAKEIDAHELYKKSLKLKAILDSTQGNVQQGEFPESEEPIAEGQSLPAEEHWGRAMLAHLHSDFETAVDHAMACVDLGQAYANTFLTLGGYFVLGMSQASSGNYQGALENLNYALELSETAEDRFWRARLLNTVGWVYRELFDFERAISFDEASLALARLGDPRLTEAEGNALANLATDYLLLEDYDRVREYLIEGLTPSDNEPFMRWRYHTRMIVIKGRLALAEGDMKTALAAADEAWKVARDTQARKNIARSCRLRGETLLAMGKVKKARAALRHSLSVGISLKCPSLIWPCQIALAHLEENEGNLEIAQTYYFDAAEVLFNLTNYLTEPALYQTFWKAPQVQKIFARAICPI